MSNEYRGTVGLYAERDRGRVNAVSVGMKAPILSVCRMGNTASLL